jgi:hypothetical protein
LKTGVAIREPEFDRDRIFQQASTHYLEMLDSTGKPPKREELIASLCESHPNYDAVQLRTLLNESEFDSALKTRRQRHLVERTAAKLLAAEMGSRLGVDAIEALQKRLKDKPDSIAAKDLVEMAKLGMNLNASIDKDLTEATGDVKITMHLKDVLIGLPPERAAILMAEYGRAMASPRAKGEVIDGSSTEE